MQELVLKRRWAIGDPIGEGGFGRVFLAESGIDQAVAKFVPKEPGAERELLFEDLEGVRNIVPIVDSGETETEWVLVMPRAEMSLRDCLEAANGAIELAIALAIARDVATALADLEGKVVHRDIKPENVLLLEGHWCLADFGISRYAEATTAPDTHKYAWTPPYAAPEQWRHERASAATDMYALGVMTFELLMGARPFTGPDFRQQHLHDAPPSMPMVPAAISTLVTECLFKPPAARPPAKNFLARLDQFTSSPASEALGRLAEANRAEVERRAESARLESEARTEQERRTDLLSAARVTFQQISSELRETILAHAPAAAARPRGRLGWEIQLGSATITLDDVTATSSSPWGNWEAPRVDVIGHSTLSVRFPPDRSEYEGRSHSLWFCNAQDGEYYTWHEIAFMISALIPKRGRQNPFALAPSVESAMALWMGISEYQVAWRFTHLTVGDLTEFVERWAGWFADAATGNLRHPDRMPER